MLGPRMGGRSPPVWLWEGREFGKVSGDAGEADREPVVDDFEWWSKDFALFPEGCGYFWY